MSSPITRAEVFVQALLDERSRDSRADCHDGPLTADFMAGHANAVLRSLHIASSNARYMREPYDDHPTYPRFVIDESLEAVFEFVQDRPEAAWWSRTCMETEQYRVLDEGQPPGDRDVDATLGAWRKHLLEEELEWERILLQEPQARPAAWWSTPRVSQVMETTGPAGSLPAVGVYLAEDGPNEDDYTVAEVALPEGGTRSLEITSVQDWVHLVESFPLEVTHVRGALWNLYAGDRSRWFMPDWSAVAQNHDAVHLSVSGWLWTSGVAVEVLGGRSMCAGWNPDATLWLNQQPQGVNEMAYHADDHPRLFSFPSAEE